LAEPPLVMVVHPSVPANNIKEYIALAKAQPQLLTFASGGTGAITQLLGEKLKLTAGISVREVPYKAIGAELPDLLAGHVSTAYLAPVVVAQHISRNLFQREVQSLLNYIGTNNRRHLHHINSFAKFDTGQVSLFTGLTGGLCVLKNGQ
jgi:hypothetical protein